MRRCLNLIRAAHYEEARSRLAPIIADHPQWARAQLMLALTYHEEQRYEMAKPLFAEALRLNPAENSVRPFYGWCLYYLGEPSAAREQFEAYLKVNAKYADAHFALGLIDFEEDRLDDAITRMNRTIELAQQAGDARTEGKAHARLGDIHLRRNNLEDARTELLKAVELRKDAYEAYYKLARVYQRLGDPEKAKWARSMHEQIRESLHPTGKVTTSTRPSEEKP